MTPASAHRFQWRQAQGLAEGLVVVVQGRLVPAEQDTFDPARGQVPLHTGGGG